MTGSSHHTPRQADEQTLSARSAPRRGSPAVPHLFSCFLDRFLLRPIVMAALGAPVGVRWGPRQAAACRSWRHWYPRAWYLGTRVHPWPPRWPVAAWVLPLSRESCGHSSQTSSWEGEEGCVIRGKAYRWHLLRRPHFPSLPAAPAHPLPSPAVLGFQ